MVGNWIYLHRKKEGYSQLELAKMCGLSQQHLAHVEAGNRSVGNRMLMNLRVLLKFTMCELEEYMDNPEAKIAAATVDDLDAIKNLGISLSDASLELAIQQERIYVLKTPWTLLGVCGFSVFQNEPYLHSFFIDQNHCKQGHDKELLEFWENAMRNLGYESVIVSTQGDGVSKYFYEKLGYRYVGFVQAKTCDCEILVYRKHFAVCV